MVLKVVMWIGVSIICMVSLIAIKESVRGFIESDRILGMLGILLGITGILIAIMMIEGIK